MRSEEGKGFGCADLGAIIFLAMIGGAILGGILGAALGDQEIGRIAAGVRKEHPNDPLDGLGIIFIGYAVEYLVWGWLIGTVTGVILVLALWLKTTSTRRPDACERAIRLP